MSDKTLRILWMWPDILNLHGERGNLLALQRVAKAMGLATEVRRVTRLADTPDFAWADLALIGPGELAVMPAAAAALAQHRAGLETFLHAGGGLFCTGTSGSLFGRATARQDGTGFAGLGLLGMACAERPTIFGDDVIFAVEGVAAPVCGVQIQMMDTRLDAGQAPLGRIEYGRGNCADGGEGARSGNLWFTNALGPVLVKNPWLAEAFVRAVMIARRPDLALPAPADDWSLEQRSSEGICRFNREKTQPTQPTPAI